MALEDAFRRMARTRPKMAEGAGVAAGLESAGVREEVERVLERVSKDTAYRR
jgi:hypothetical protein